MDCGLAHGLEEHATSILKVMELCPGGH